MLNPLVSIIVPVYNTKEELPIAIESLLKQTYHSIEILLIDDGSTDGSEKICDQYANQYDHIFVYHIPNHGQGYARNFGVKKASGNWIVFLDSDDYYIDCAIEYMMFLREKFNADIVLTNLLWTKESHNSHHQLVEADFTAAHTVNFEKALELIYHKEFSGISPVAKLYAKDLLISHPYTQGHIHEDMDTTYRILSGSQCIALGDLVTYYYIGRDDSTTRRDFDESMLYFFDAIDHNIKFCQKHFPKNEVIKEGLINQYVINGMAILLKMLEKNYFQEVKLHQIKMRAYWRIFLKSQKVKWQYKVWYIIFCLSPVLFKFGKSIKRPK